ncbi:hypothetical protein ACS0Y3_22285, partial [Burkholderia gladioli]|uniref:hypothetical protein n=1 Tax=Burkholderia gladioli TaxID=28095 RepID=UPI003F79CAFA
MRLAKASRNRSTQRRTMRCSPPRRLGDCRTGARRLLHCVGAGSIRGGEIADAADRVPRARRRPGTRGTGSG